MIAKEQVKQRKAWQEGPSPRNVVNLGSQSQIPTVPGRYRE